MKCIKTCLILIFPLLFNTTSLPSQTAGILLNDSNWNYGKVMEMFESSFTAYNNPILELPDEKIQTWNGDTLKVTFYYFNALSIYQYVFEKIDDKINPESKVIFQQASMGCGLCADKAIKYYKSRKSKFRPCGDNTFLSSYKQKTRLKMVEENGNPSCLTLTFIPEYLDKKAYKKLYRSLPKSN